MPRGDREQQGPVVIDPAQQLLGAPKHLDLGRLQDAVAAAQHGQRQGYRGLLTLLSVPLQQFVDRPKGWGFNSLQFHLVMSQDIGNS